MVRLIITFTITLLAFNLQAQKYATRNGYVKFFSKTHMENIEAITNQASCIADISTGEVVSKILIKSFKFEKALMQEHFNENYLESDKFPQAQLKAKIINHSNFDFKSTEIKEITIEGEITIHGVTKPITIKANVVNKEGKITASSVFMVRPADFNIKIPKAVVNNIAKEIEVSLKFELEALAQSK